jgi:uncharacterized protein (TIGR03437 family)
MSTAGGGVPTGIAALYIDSMKVDVALDAVGHGSFTLPSGQQGPFSAGSHHIAAAYGGDAKFQAGLPAVLTIPVAKVGSMVTVGLVPTQINQPTTLRAVVSLANWSPAPVNGIVDFSSDGDPIAGCIGLPVRNGAAACNPTFPQTGNVTIGASYSGDENANPSTRSAQLTVGKMAASPYLAAWPAAPIFGQKVTISALVLGANGVAAPAGTVTFRDGSLLLEIVALEADGRATLTMPAAALPMLHAGAHTITATYNGDASYGAAEPVSVNLPIGRAVTQTTLAAQPGGPFVATVAVQSPGSGAPAGTVQFLRNGIMFGTAPLVPQASSSTATIAGSAQSGILAATYPGSTDFIGSTTTPVAVAAPSAAVFLTSDHNPSVAGQTVTFSVYLSPVVGTVTPSGSVSLAMDGKSLGTTSLSGAQATFTATPTVGTHALKADYPGDGVYPAASGEYSQLTVGPALPSFTAGNAASYDADRFSPDEIVTLFGSNLARENAAANTSVQVIDENGTSRPAALLLVSPSQVNFVIPGETAAGSATISLTSPAGTTQAPIRIAGVGPGLFTANSTARGAAAGQAILVHADGSTESPRDLAVFEAAQNVWDPAPIHPCAGNGTVYLVLYGTGIRHYNSAPTCSINGQSAPVTYAGAQGSYAGLDQINIRLPASLEGVGTASLILMVDGTVSNAVTLLFP